MDEKKLSPIALFVYNRPYHTLKTLESLYHNRLSDQSSLYIFADGPKVNASKDELAKIKGVREIIRKQKWCGEVFIEESAENKGLADSIISGVTKIVNKYGKVIVLEDDLVTSAYFLEYMNEALDFYKDEKKVMHISGYMFPVKEKLPPTFFYNTASCWGWATWKRAWDYFESDARLLKEKIEESGLVKKFNIEGTYGFMNQLERNANGTAKTWAVKWYASIFLNNGLSLHPYPSLVNNIGHDGTGEHYLKSDKYNWPKLADRIEISKIELKESLTARKAMKQFNKNKIFLAYRIKNKFGKLLPYKIKNIINIIIDKKSHNPEVLKISKIPRYTEAMVNFLGRPIKIIDSASFVSAHKAIFQDEIYRFKTDKIKPYILDCGANIGLSVIYLKKLYPDSVISAFEPDKKAFDALKFNVNSFDLKDVELINKALWREETSMSFFSQGADGSRIALENDDKNIVKVDTLRLKSFIDKPVDLLKLDIEGAETAVLEDSQESLANVKNLFVEYHSFINKEQELDKLLKILKQAGFRYYVQHVGVNSPYPFMKINSALGMDNQLNIFAYRN